MAWSEAGFILVAKCSRVAAGHTSGWWPQNRHTYLENRSVRVKRLSVEFEFVKNCVILLSC